MLTQPGHSLLGNLTVVVLVMGVAFFGQVVVQTHHHAGLFGFLCIEAAQQTLESAFAFMQVHGQYFFGEPVVVVAAAVVQFADGRNVVPLLAQAMHPAGNRTVIGHDVVPIASLVRITAGRHGRACGAAQRAGAVGIRKTRAALGDGIDMRRLHHRMPIAADYRPAVVVSHEDHKALGYGHLGLLNTSFI